MLRVEKWLKRKNSKSEDLPTPQAIEPQAIVQQPQPSVECRCRRGTHCCCPTACRSCWPGSMWCEVSSQRFKSSMYRRYNDFVVFQEMLLHQVPHRMVPALPPKRMLGADREFTEARRRALKRFLFLSFSGVENKLKESAQCLGDELMNCKLAARAKDFLPADIQAQFAISRELIRNINSFHKLRDRAERIASGAIDKAAYLLIFGKHDTTPLPSWAALNSSTWGSLKQALKGLSVEFGLLADKAHEKGMLHKHQRALQKYSLMKRQMMSAAVQNRGLESSRIVEQENAIQTMELRSYFSLYCLHQETQLIHVYLPLTSHILGSGSTLVNSQIQGHKEMSKVWNDLRPKLSCLFAGPHSALTPPPSLPQSPLEDGLCPH
uniref:PX domain-containing protein n=1 Tax=Saimiri boliviensis boliviensis TaxID=39432 RepID=A0A2K6URN3_SAIBB